MNEITIKVPLYLEEITIIFFTDEQQIKERFPESEPESFIAKVLYEDGTHYVIFDLKENLTHGIIAHEAYHLMNNIFKVIGHKTHMQNHEPEAYLLEWIVNEIYKIKNK